MKTRVLYEALSFLFRIKHFAEDWRGLSNSGFPIDTDDYPTGLGIEVTNLCNANCVFCAYQYRQRPTTSMSYEMFKSAMNQYVALGKDKTGIGLTPVVGDPLVDRDLVRKIEYARSISQIHNIHMTTNAILLTRELFDRLVDAGLNMMTISMSGFDSKEYERTYRNNQYANVVKNLRVIARSDRFKKCKIEIGLRTSSLFPWLKKEYCEFRSLGFKISRNWFFDNWSGKIKENDLHGMMFLRPERKSKRIPCTILYKGPHVLADGTITACGCRDLEGTSELRLGNLRENFMAQILSGGKLEGLRQRFLAGDLPDVCRDCKYYKSDGFEALKENVTK